MTDHHSGSGELLTYAAPVYFIGDSHARIFSNCLYRAADGTHEFSVTKHVHLLQADTVLVEQHVNPLLLDALITESLITLRGGAPQAVHRLPARERAEFPQGENDPSIVFMLGELDIRLLCEGLGEDADCAFPIAIPDTDGLAFPASPRMIPVESFEATLTQRLTKLSTFLDWLRALGFGHMYLHSIPPQFPPREQRDDPAWKPPALGYKLRHIFHAMYRDFAARSGIAFIDTWDEVAEFGRARPEFFADGLHLNNRANAVTMNRVLRAQGRADCTLVGRCRPVYAIGDSAIAPFKNIAIKGASGTHYATRVQYIEDFTLASLADPASRQLQRFYRALRTDAALVLDETVGMAPHTFPESRAGGYDPRVLVSCAAGRAQDATSSQAEGGTLEPLAATGLRHVALLDVTQNPQLERAARARGMRYISALAGDCSSAQRIALDLVAEIESAHGARFPYDVRPERTRWRPAVTTPAARDIDPQGPAKFRFGRGDAVASAGSCFARHIAANLARQGFRYFVTEPGSEYSAAFGNIYTTLHLLQLFKRAYGTFVPLDAEWGLGTNFVDAFRPRHRPGGYFSLAELDADRAAHFAAVRRMFEGLDVFFFTLGLTEAWCSKLDDAQYPVCPGKDVGTFSPERYYYRNLSVAENVAYLTEFLTLLREVNPKARVILTVSPVPLVATMEDTHVLRASVYSKSVLRVAANEVAAAHAHVDYFASYEIITSTFNVERYFEADRRSVNAAGVAHVMGSLFANFSAEQLALDEAGASEPLDPCDEDVLAALLERDFQ